jgi:hypothetical protein
MDGMEEFEGVEGISDLVGDVECDGRAVIDGSQWSANWIGADQFVGTAWLVQQQRPDLKVRITDVTNWTQATDKKGQPVSRDLFEAKLTFEIQVGENSITRTTPCSVRFRAPTSKGAKYAMQFRTTFSFEGKELALTEDDAGTIEAKMVVEGFSSMSGNTEEQLKKSLDDPSLPSLD